MDTATPSSLLKRRTLIRVWARWDCGCAKSRTAEHPSGIGWFLPRGAGMRPGWPCGPPPPTPSRCLAIPRLQLFIEPWNAASQRTAEYGGFVQEALLHGWERIDGTQHDVYCYALLQQDWNAQRPIEGHRCTRLSDARRVGPCTARPRGDGHRPLWLTALDDGRLAHSGPRRPAVDWPSTSRAPMRRGLHMRPTAAIAANTRRGPWRWSPPSSG